jgi:TfoX/Sxy family transcriptional regulator of competence genes
VCDVAYDEELADRIRAEIGPLDGLTEKAMFGGLAFLVHGNMAVAVSRQGGILVRVDPDQTEKLVATTAATEMMMRGRPARGWLLVGADDVRTKRQLTPWVKRGLTCAGSLPPKKPTKKVPKRQS